MNKIFYVVSRLTCKRDIILLLNDTLCFFSKSQIIRRWKYVPTLSQVIEIFDVDYYHSVYYDFELI
jgi:hypothetical protein